MKVCHVTFSFTIGGIENLLVDVLKEQSKNADVSLIVVNRAFNSQLLSRISKDVQVELIGRRPGNKLSFIHILKLWKLLRKLKPDVIHCHADNLIRILFPFRRKCIYTVHELGVPTTYLNRYKRLFAISNAVKDDLLSRGRLKSEVVFNGVDADAFVRKDGYEYNADDLFRVVQISRLQHETKGQDILIEAVKILVHERRVGNIRVYIIGDGPSEGHLRDVADRYRLSNHVIFLGPKDRSWIYNNLFSYHLLVQPSRFEGFGLTVLESLFAGLPVVASSVGGPAEILDGVPAALLFKSEDAVDLADKIQTIIEFYSNGNIETLSKMSLRYIGEKYSVTTTANNYLEQYTNIN